MNDRREDLETRHFSSRVQWKPDGWVPVLIRSLPRAKVDRVVTGGGYWVQLTPQSQATGRTAQGERSESRVRKTHRDKI